jgi:hypothetical protein
MFLQSASGQALVEIKITLELLAYSFDWDNFLDYSGCHDILG